MKKMILLSTLLVSSTVLGAAIAHAEETVPPRNTTAEIVFMEDTDQTPPVNPLEPDPGNPVEPENPDGSTPEAGTPGPLSFDFASNLSFGEVKIAVKDKTYTALPQNFSSEAGGIGPSKQAPNYVQITDKRGGAKGWTLSVRQEGQFKSSKKGTELAGAKLTFTNAQIDTVSETPRPDAADVQDTIDLTLDENGNGVANNVVVAKEGTGFGTYVYRFGTDKTEVGKTSETIEDDNSTRSIQLLVPGATVKENDAYKAALTWTLAALPGADAGEGAEG